MGKSASGDIWIPANSRPSWLPVLLEWTVPSTAFGPSAFLGRNPIAASRCSSNASPSKNPCWRDGLVLHCKQLLSRGSVVRPFGNFERPE
jgi:hypothetical protein